MKSRPWLMWTMAVLFYFYQYIIRVATGNLREPLTEEFALSASQYGWFSACWLITYAVMQVPVGLALDRLGPRRVLAISAAFCGFGSLLMLFADTYVTLCISRLLLGAGSASAFITTVKVSSDWFGYHRLPVLVGVVSGVGVIGASIAGAPIVMLQTLLGWRWLFGFLSLIAFALTVLYAFFMRDKQHDDQRTKSSALSSIKRVLSEPKVWLLGTVGFLLYLPVSVLADLWGPSFIRSVYGYSTVKSAFAMSFVFYGNALGCFSVGWVFLKFATHRRFFFTFVSLAACLMGVLVWVEMSSFAGLVTLLALLGAVVGAENMVFPLGGRCVSEKDQAVATSVVNLFVTFGAVIFQPIVGVVLDAFWQGAMAEGHPVYTASEFRCGLSSVFVALAIGAFVSLLLKGRKV